MQTYSASGETDAIYLVGFGNSVARVLEASRVSVAWIPVGICQGAIEKTVSYVAERQAFGAALHSNQIVQGKISAESEVNFKASAPTPCTIYREISPRYRHGCLNVLTH